ncbi:MAG: ABC transporter permease [Candidatus Limnocylindria bacterium]
MRKYILRRLLYAIPTLIGISVIVFAISRLAPGDPVQLYTFGIQDITQADIDRIRAAHGLDKPLPLQYVTWVTNAIQGDFGRSIIYPSQNASRLIIERIPNTIQLALAALMLQLLIGVPLGIIAALNRGKIIDQVARFFSTIGQAVPDFWMGLIFIIVFSVTLRLLPSQGMLTIGKDQWDIADRFRHIIMPAFVLAFGGIALFTRLLRTETLEVIRQDYIRTAEAKGLSDRVVVYRHALRNALIPVVTALGGVLTFLISGALVIEQVFTWPGVGQLTFQSAVAKDYPVVMAGVMIASTMLVISYLLRDLTYALVDPRIKVG